MNLKLEINDDFINQLEDKLGKQEPRKLIKDALTLLNWAATEAEQGRIICSANVDGEEMKQLDMPALNKIKRIKTSS